MIISQLICIYNSKNNKCTKRRYAGVVYSVLYFVVLCWVVSSVWCFEGTWTLRSWQQGM